VGIDLRGGDIRVSEDGLHGTQIGAVFHHVSGAAMPQHVRAGDAPRAG
jgi:hypothetical protein